MDPVLSLRDLDHWSFAGTALAVLGQPIKHSLSPAMHNAALAAMADRDARYRSWKYFRFEVSPDDLPDALTRLHARKFHGINLTVPHKILAVSQAETVEDDARAIGAVNTLLRTESGWRGYNTDGYGLAAGIREDLRFELTDAPVILLGAGGAARGAAVECLRQGCSSLWICNRTAHNLDALLAMLAPIAVDVPRHGFALAGPPQHFPAGAIVINATSAGLRAGDTPPLDLSRIPRPAAVYDMIYNPPETPLLAAARGLRVPAANGLSMLVHQGARALAIWTGESVPVGVMRTAAVEASRANSAGQPG